MADTKPLKTESGRTQQFGTGDTVPLANGGTGATDAAGARTNLEAAGTGVSNTFTANQVITTSSTSAALRVTQTGSGHALLVEDAANPDSTPFVVDNSGYVVHGHTARVATITSVSPYFQIHHNVASLLWASQSITNWVAGNTSGANIIIGKSRSGTPGTYSVVANGDILGYLTFAGDSGTQFEQGARIAAVVDGTPSATSMPAKIGIATTAEGSVSPTERVTIRSAGNVGIANANPAEKLDVTGNIKASGVFLAPDGTAAAPSIANSDHTGTGISFGTNTLSVSTAGVERAKFDAVGHAIFQTGWKDITADIVVRGLGSDPSYTQIGTSPYYAYKFTIGKKCYITFHINHDYKPGGAIHLHAHWLSGGTNTTNGVVWQFKYSVIKGHNQSGGDLSMTGTTIAAPSTTSGGRYRHMISETTASITVTDAEVDALIMVEVERITNGGTDNSDDIFLLTVDCHYEAQYYATKNKAPNFYT